MLTKKLRFTVALLLTLSFVIPLTHLPAAAESVSSEQTAAASDSTPDTVLTTALQEKLVAADKNELIPVTIRLNDSIDLDAVE